MGGGTTRRLVAGGVLLACLVALPGQAQADHAPAVSIADASVSEGDGGTTPKLLLTVTRAATPDVLEVSTVTATISGESTESGDFSAVSPQVITFAAGDDSETVEISVNGDTTYEEDETLKVTLSAPVNATIADGEGTGTITNDDAPPTATVTGPSGDVSEGSSAEFTIRLAATAERDVDVQYQTEDGTAKKIEDYTPAPANASVRFSPGEQEKAIPIATPVVEALDEDLRETFSVRLPASGSTATATILDNDDPPIATIANAPDVTEGGIARFPVTLDRRSGRVVNVTYRTTNGSASSGSDFKGESAGSIQIAVGTLTGEIAVETIETLDGSGRPFAEPDETFSVGLTANETLRLAPPKDEAIAKILDDEPPATPTISSASGPEGNSGTTELKFDVNLPGPRPQVTFNYRTVAGTANESDFVEVGGAQITLPASSASSPPPQQITIRLRGDLLDELDESFTVQLLNPTTEAVVASATGTIVNDDNNTELLLADTSVDEPQTGNSTLKFTLSLSVASGRMVSVSWQTADGTATAGTDYTGASGSVDFAPGETSKVIDVTVIGDTINEENETVVVNVSGSGATLIDSQAIGTIIDKNAPPSLSISDPLARESEGAKFTVTLAGTTLRTVTVRFSTADGSGKAGSDYSSRVGSLTFAPGEKTKTIEVTVLDDAASEPNEDFFVLLDDAVNATITKGRGRASIEASDQVAAPTPPPATPPKTPVVGKPTTVLVPRMILGPRTVSVGPNGIARMLVTCQKASPIGCAGTVELERAGKPLLKLGKRAFSVKKGAKGYASIKLTTRGLAALRKSGTLRAKVVVIVKTSAKSMKVSPGIIVLKSVKTVAKPKPPTTKVVVDP